jgi:hypothetical protein
VLRLIIPMPTWEDYLTLAFDEIRQFGMTSIQVMRRLRAALTGLAESTTIAARAEAVERYLKHLDLAIERSPLDVEDRRMALQEDRQGLGLSRPPRNNWSEQEVEDAQADFARRDASIHIRAAVRIAIGARSQSWSCWSHWN